MNILIVTPMLPPQIGGPGTHATLVIKEFPKRGIKVSVVNFAKVLFLPRGIRHAIFFIQVFFAALGKDVIYDLGLVSTGYPSLLVAKLLRKRYIIRTAGIHAWEQGVQQAGVTENLDEFIEAYVNGKEFPHTVVHWIRLQLDMVAYAEKVIVPSQYFKQLYLKLGVSDEKIQVVYSSYESQFDDSVLTNKREPGLIVSAGRMVPWKGFGVLLEVLSELDPSMRLVLIGDGEECAELEQKTRNLGLQNRVTFTGKLEHKKLLEYFSRAELFVLNTGYEGLSHTILEAFDAGVPVITTPVGGNVELLEDGISGTLVPYNDINKLREAIASLHSNPEVRNQQAKVAKESVQKFSLERSIGALRDIFTENPSKG